MALRSRRGPIAKIEKFNPLSEVGVLSLGIMLVDVLLSEGRSGLLSAVRRCGVTWSAPMVTGTFLGSPWVE